MPEFTRSGTRRPIAIAALAVSGAIALSGCSSPAAAPAAGESELFDQEIAELLPDPIKEAGEIQVGTSPVYPPMIDLGEDGVTISGSETELLRLIGKVLGVEMVFHDIKFDALFPALESGKVDMEGGAMGITAERLQTVDFVSDFQAGTTLLVPGGNPQNLSIETICGQHVGVQKGSTEEVVTIPEWDADCTSEGRPAIKVSTFPAAADAVLALHSGRVSATVAALPAAIFQASQSDGTLEALEINYNPSPWGFVFPDESDLPPAIAAALQKLIDGGEYVSILERFGVEGGAIDTAEIYTDPSQSEH